MFKEISDLIKKLTLYNQLKRFIQGFQGQVQVGNVQMSRFYTTQFVIGSKVCWSPEAPTYYCLNPMSCPNQDADLGDYSFLAKP
jgi:hypothetical protein